MLWRTRQSIVDQCMKPINMLVFLCLQQMLHFNMPAADAQAYGAFEFGAWGLNFSAQFSRPFLRDYVQISTTSAKILGYSITLGAHQASLAPTSYTYGQLWHHCRLQHHWPVKFDDDVFLQSSPSYKFASYLQAIFNNKFDRITDVIFLLHWIYFKWYIKFQHSKRLKGVSLIFQSLFCNITLSVTTD